MEIKHLRFSWTYYCCSYKTSLPRLHPAPYMSSFTFTCLIDFIHTLSSTRIQRFQPVTIWKTTLKSMYKFNLPSRAAPVVCAVSAIFVHILWIGTSHIDHWNHWIFYLLASRGLMAAILLKGSKKRDSNTVTQCSNISWSLSAHKSCAQAHKMLSDARTVYPGVYLQKCTFTFTFSGRFRLPGVAPEGCATLPNVVEQKHGLLSVWMP